MPNLYEYAQISPSVHSASFSKGEWLPATIEGEWKTKHVKDERDEYGNLMGHRNPYRIELQRDIHGPDVEVAFGKC